MRELYKPRLEAAGLWPTETEAPSEQSKLGVSVFGGSPPAKDPKEIARSIFALEEVHLDLPFPELCMLKVVPEA